MFDLLECVYFKTIDLTLIISFRLFLSMRLYQVIWFKETMQLDTTERHIMGKKGSRHTLMIRKVHPQDFGNYSCVAENPLGKTRKTLQLTGKPNTAVFRSAPTSQYKDR